MKRQAISNYIKPVVAFCKIGDVLLNMSKINKFMPAHIKSKKTYGYTHTMIQKLLDIADERMRVVILPASGCGLRIGSIPGLDVVRVKSLRICIRLPFMRTDLKNILYSVHQN